MKCRSQKERWFRSRVFSVTIALPLFCAVLAGAHSLPAQPLPGGANAAVSVYVSISGFDEFVESLSPPIFALLAVAVVLFLVVVLRWPRDGGRYHHSDSHQRISDGFSDPPGSSKKNNNRDEGAYRKDFNTLGSELASQWQVVINLQQDVNNLKDKVEAISKRLDAQLGSYVPFQKDSQTSKHSTSVNESGGAGQPPTPNQSQDGQSIGGQQEREKRAPDEAVPIVAPPALPRVLYARSPRSDGTFKQVLEMAEFESLYEIRLDGNPATTREAAVLIFENPEQFKTALNSPANYLTPACEYVNAPSGTTTRIRTVTPGRAARATPGDPWRITEKVRITFS